MRADQAEQRKTYPKHLQRGMSVRSEPVFLVQIAEAQDLEAHNIAHALMCVCGNVTAILWDNKRTYICLHLFEEKLNLRGSLFMSGESGKGVAPE